MAGGTRVVDMWEGDIRVDDVRVVDMWEGDIRVDDTRVDHERGGWRTGESRKGGCLKFGRVAIRWATWRHRRSKGQRSYCNRSNDQNAQPKTRSRQLIATPNTTP